MMQLIGFLIALNSFIIAGWWIATEHPNKVAVVTLCLIAVFFGIFLIIKDRVTEITIKSVGTIKAATEQAVLDAKQIKDIRERMEAQSATVELVAKHASDAERLSAEAKILAVEAKNSSKDLEQKNKIADEKLLNIDEAVKKATGILSELQSLSEFTSTVLAAQNNDRKAFDLLNIWAKDKSHPFSAKAQQAYNTIMDEHSKPYYVSGFTIPWQNGVDPTKLTLQDLQRNYNSAPVYLRPALIEYIWGRVDIDKKDRMQFLVDIIEQDDNLNAVEYAGRYFTQEASLKIKPLAIEYLLNWWKENKDKIK